MRPRCYLVLVILAGFTTSASAQTRAPSGLPVSAVSPAFAFSPVSQRVRLPERSSRWKEGGAVGATLLGIFGLAAGIKSQAPRAPLWALMLATQWLDVFFVPLFLLGIERIEPAEPGAALTYGGAVIHANYTHSLVGAALLAALAGLLAAGRWGARIGGVIGAVAFSHWLSGPNSSRVSDGFRSWPGASPRSA